MIRIEPVDASLAKEFIFFNKHLYQGSSCYFDSLRPLVESFLSKKGEYFKHAQVESFLVFLSGNLKGRFSLIYDEKNPLYFQVGFMDFYPELISYREKIVDFIKDKAKKVGAKTIVYRMEGHLNNSIGFLDSHYHTPQLFGYPYNYPYYHKFFTGFLKRTSHSYLAPIRKGNLFKEDKIIKRLLKKGFYLKKASFSSSQITTTVSQYTYLNNEAFSSHIYWAPRTVAEDLELFREFSYFLKEDNLIFCYDKNSQPVGFILWYDDFNQLLQPGESLNLYHYFIYKTRLKKIKTAKLAEIAVLPAYQKRGIPYLLLANLYDYLASKNYRECECGWIMDENRDSVLLVKQFLSRGIKRYRRFAIYEDRV